MSKPYLSYGSVELAEYEDVTTRYWTATASGKLTPSKVRVHMTRTAPSAGEALDLLRTAIQFQGWELRE